MPRVFSSIIIGIFVIGIIFGVVYLINNNSLKQPNISQPQPTSVTISSPTIAPTPEVKSYPGTKEFISQKLKIAFNYLPNLPKVDDQEVKVKEISNKVYVSLGNAKIEDGQFVEVFSKDPQDSLNEAIRKKFLTNKSAKECFVVKSSKVFSNYPASYQAVEISFPKPTNSEEPWWSQGGKCAADYEQTNGIRYFLGDNLHPDKFLFFSIGQYGISASSNLSWQDTIRFLD